VATKSDAKTQESNGSASLLSIIFHEHGFFPLAKARGFNDPALGLSDFNSLAEEM
jgi:hypothetical protein